MKTLVIISVGATFSILMLPSVSSAEAKCQILSEYTHTENRTDRFGTTNLSATTGKGLAGLACQGDAGPLRFDIAGITKTDGTDTVFALRTREFKLGFDVGDAGFLTLGYDLHGTDPSYILQPLSFFGDSSDYASFRDRFYDNQSSWLVNYDFSTDLLDFSFAVGENRRLDRDALQAVATVQGSTGALDYQLIARATREQGLGLGGALSTIIGNNLVLHGSVFAQRGSSRPYHIGALTGQQKFWTVAEAPVARHKLNSDEVVPRIVLGGQFTYQNGDNLLLEFVYDGEGMTASEWSNYVQLTDFHVAGGAPAAAIAGNLGLDLSALQATNMRNYAFLRYSKDFGKSNVSLSALINLEDQSVRASISYDHTVSNQVDLVGNFSFAGGKAGSEFDVLPERLSASLGLYIQF